MSFARAVENQCACFGNRRLRCGDADVEPEDIVCVRSNTELFHFEISEMEQAFDFGIVGNSDACCSFRNP